MPHEAGAGILTGMRLAALVLSATLFTPGTIAFRIAEPDLIPEGIAYDPATKTFFIGSTFKRKIVAVDAAGKARDFAAEAQDGVFGFLGLRVDAKRRTLWAISSNAGGTMPARGLDKTCLGCSTITAYDLDSGKLLKKYELSNKPAVHFLNDLVLTENGDVYVTDTMSGDIFRITREKDTLESWVSLGPQTYPNGITLAGDGRTLFVASAAGIRAVGTADGRITPVEIPGAARVPSIDGLYWFSGSLIAIQPFEAGSKIVRYRLSPENTITGTDVIEGEHPLFKQPTTGVVVDSDFYFIANAQLQFFRAMYKDGAYDRSLLSEVVVVKSSLATRR